jgi:Cytochrome c554 and c-prime
MAEVDAEHEPPDGTFHSDVSGRSYSIYRKDGELHHEEVLRTAEGTEIARVDLPVRYVVGSGHFARAYVAQVDGFLHESPLAWYASKNAWGMSPGYESRNHGSFERPVMRECLACHAGRVEEKDGAVHRLNIYEQAIGCESCHGPGSRHQELHRSSKLTPGTEDLTIVHPGRLPRPLLESICGACHLGDPATVPLRGREISDFQPGRPLSDFRIHYRFEGSNGPMTLVGHVDQLRQSACYQKSPEMSCLTCHDPHARSQPADRTVFYREKCLSCHDTRPCKLDSAERLKKQANDSCVACHMPRGDTEVPHVAFTHHRIGLHPLKASGNGQGIPDLVPTDDVSHLSAQDQERSLGLAYLKVRRNSPSAPYAAVYRERAREHLEAVYSAGLRDADTVMGLSEIYWRVDRQRACAFAREGLQAPVVSSRTRAMALMIIGYSDFQERDDEAATASLEQLVQLRRFADDWRVLGISRLRQNQPETALVALQKALEIRPFRPSIHTAIADVYEQLGQHSLAEDHAKKARWLSEHNQD